jgi:hypothetical protein
MTIRNPMRSLFGYRPGIQWAIGLQMIPLHQYLENELLQLD